MPPVSPPASSYPATVHGSLSHATSVTNSSPSTRSVQKANPLYLSVGFVGVFVRGFEVYWTSRLFLLRHPGDDLTFQGLTLNHAPKKKNTDRDSFPPAWLEAMEPRQDPGENGRRIEHFIGDNEHLQLITGGRPVYCQNLISGGRLGLDSSRYVAVRGGHGSSRSKIHDVVERAHVFTTPALSLTCVCMRMFIIPNTSSSL